MNQLNLWSVYNGAKDIHAAAQALGRVTIDPCYVHDECTPRRTIYREVMADMAPSDCDDLLERRSERSHAPLSEIAEVGLEALIEAVGAIPSGLYYMPFSAGYDSRLILALLCQAGVDVTRVTWEPERAEATDVARLVAEVTRRFTGLYLAGPFGTDDYWRDALLPMLDHGRRISDPWRWQGGRHYLPTAPLDGAISALWADETLGGFACAKQSMTLGEWAKRRCMDQPVRDLGPWYTPFASRQWLERVILRYHLTECEDNTDEIRLYERFSAGDTLKRAMLRLIDPRLLDIPNPRFELAMRTRPPHNEVLAHNRLSPQLQAELAEASGLDVGDRVGPEPWLREYSRAAIVVADRAGGVAVQE